MAKVKIEQELADKAVFQDAVKTNGVNACKKLFYDYSPGTVQRAYHIAKAINDNQPSTAVAAPQENAEMAVQQQVQVQAPVEITVPITGTGADILNPPPKLNLNDCIILNLTLKKPGIRRRVSTDDIECDTDKTALSVSKEILDSEELKKVRVLDVSMGKYIKEHCLPAGSFLKGGMSLVAPARLVEIDETLQGMIASRNEVIEEFMLAYPALINAAKTRLKGLFNDADYPNADILRGGFMADVSYQSFMVAGALKGISAAIAKREEDKARERALKAAAAIETSLYQAALDLVNNIREKLNPADITKAKKFRADTVDKWKAFFSELKDRNITGSTDIEHIADLGLQALKGVDTMALKGSDDKRKEMDAAFANLEPLLQTSLQNVPKRAMNLD